MPDSAHKIVLVHISDIHFHYKKDAVAGTATLDADIRHELKRDVFEVVKNLGQAHGILVTGDIAFAGRIEEYQAAEQWLLELCNGVGCAEENIWVICGNHDVQRDIIKQSKLLRDFQRQLRECESKQTESVFGEILSDSVGRGAVFTPLHNYNEFARKFGGHFSSEQLQWQEDIVLNDGSKLRLHGVNSALGSNEADSIDRAKLSLGPGRCAVERVAGVEYVLLCHHPADWLRDADEVLPYIDSRMRLQLYGHKHRLRVVESSVRGFPCLKLHAGAVNPERSDATQPRYNCLALHVETDRANRRRTLCVELHARLWDEAQTKFVADTAEGGGNACRIIRLELEWWESSFVVAQPPAVPLTEVIAHTQVTNPLNVAVSTDTPASIMNGARRLIYRFLSLPFHQRMEVASKLNLLEDADSSVDGSELFRRLYRRASERSQLRAFYEAVEIRHDGRPPVENPFP